MLEGSEKPDRLRSSRVFWRHAEPEKKRKRQLGPLRSSCFWGDS